MFADYPAVDENLCREVDTSRLAEVRENFE
jgi:hypothetical protein